MFLSYAALEPSGPLQPLENELRELGFSEVEIAVEYCGICHSDLSMIDNEWGISQYPLVAGHEVIGKISRLGSGVSKFKIGETVGLGWHSGYCNSCEYCESGDRNLCANSKATIVGRYGGFAERVIADQASVISIPTEINERTAAPLLCGGITVFSPLLEFNVQPTDKVAVIGLGGLGHLAVRYLVAWGCDVTVLTSNPEKTSTSFELGARHVANYNDSNDLQKMIGQFDFIISTVNVGIDWPSILLTLRPKGRLHIVGIPKNEISLGAFSLISGQRSISGSPVGSPQSIIKMLEFSARHKIEPIAEFWPVSLINDALDRLRVGRARYRIIIEIKKD